MSTQNTIHPLKEQLRVWSEETVELRDPITHWLLLEKGFVHTRDDEGNRYQLDEFVVWFNVETGEFLVEDSGQAVSYWYELLGELAQRD